MKKNTKLAIGAGVGLALLGVGAYALSSKSAAAATSGGGGGGGGGGDMLAFTSGQLYSLQVTAPSSVTAAQVQSQLEAEGFTFAGSGTVPPQPSSDPSHQWDAICRFNTTSGNYPANIGLGITVTVANAVPG